MKKMSGFGTEAKKFAWRLLEEESNLIHVDRAPCHGKTQNLSFSGTPLSVLSNWQLLHFESSLAKFTISGKRKKRKDRNFHFPFSFKKIQLILPNFVTN
jgi:hypothetical protein